MKIEEGRRMVEDEKSVSSTEADLEALVGADKGWADGRCWIFGSQSPLESQRGHIAAILEPMLLGWNSHGTPQNGVWQLLEGHFVVVARFGTDNSLSGCGIDSMVAAVAELERNLGLPLRDSGRVFYRNAQGLVEGISRTGFSDAVRAGSIGRDTPVFDTTVTRVGSLFDGSFEKPLRDSWHLKLFENALRKP